MPQGCGSQRGEPEEAQVFWTHLGWTTTKHRGSLVFGMLLCYQTFLQSPNTSLISHTASDHPEIMTGEEERTGDLDPENWILLPALLPLTSGRFIKPFGISVLVSQRQRMDASPGGQRRAWRSSSPSDTRNRAGRKPKHHTAWAALESQALGPALSPELSRLLLPTLHPATLSSGEVLSACETPQNHRHSRHFCPEC